MSVIMLVNRTEMSFSVTVDNSESFEELLKLILDEITVITVEPDAAQFAVNAIHEKPDPE